ncbi:hypothetical protein BKA93DRAFT_803008 [Sparassis latifolia]|uniref:Mid2 domain-containing protein n=1 Tax=Sparassis crispa TaxID=139825 RepID=A0A401H757_9APHY|nr:hypothetical protein SCP_1900700 [Sparassis crispa]GBE90221.1 hypothetical protein SCP_1900700 [Sparassis crispa]
MSTCFSTPTATQFGSTVVNSVSTSFSNSGTSVSPSVTTIVTDSCVVSASGNVTVTGCVTSSIVSTIRGGGDSTVQVPIVLTIPVTQSSPTATLYGTTCNKSGTSSSVSSFAPAPSMAPSSPPTPTPTSVSSNQQSSSSSSSSSSINSVITTAVPTTIVYQSSSTLPGGSVVVSQMTETSTVITTLASSPTPTSGSSSNTGAIVGGIAGGAVALAILLLLAFFCVRRQRRNTDPFAAEDEVISPQVVHARRNREKTLDIDGEAHPYTYGGLANVSPLGNAEETTPYGGGGLNKGIGNYFAVPTSSPRGTTSSLPSMRRRNATPPLHLVQQSAGAPSAVSQQDDGSASSRTGGASQEKTRKIVSPVPRVAPLIIARPSNSSSAAGPSGGRTPVSEMVHTPIVHQDAGRVVPVQASRPATPIHPTKERLGTGVAEEVPEVPPPAYTE